MLARYVEKTGLDDGFVLNAVCREHVFSTSIYSQSDRLLGHLPMLEVLPEFEQAHRAHFLEARSYSLY